MSASARSERGVMDVRTVGQRPVREISFELICCGKEDTLERGGGEEASG